LLTLGSIGLPRGLFLSKHFNPCLTDRHEKCVFEIACQKNHAIEIVELFLRDGRVTEESKRKGYEAAMKAKSDEVIHLLLKDHFIKNMLEPDKSTSSTKKRKTQSNYFGRNIVDLNILREHQTSSEKMSEISTTNTLLDLLLVDPLSQVRK
jgi:hypothetical protein